MDKKIEKLSDSLVYVIAVLMIFAITMDNNIVLKILVIVNAIALLGTVVYKLVRNR